MSVDTGTTSYVVYLGTWTDWSKGRIFGPTITLNRQDGNLLIAFMAFFVALVGTRFWRLGCLVLHYIYSSDRPNDGVYHQRQAFLRNAPNPEGALWTLTDMGLSWSWKNNAKQVWARLLPLFGLAVACFVGFTFAGGFSSRIATLTSGEVLLSGANCSYTANDGNMTTYGDTIGTLLSEEMISAENYARQCYTSNPVPVSCGTYVRKQLAPIVVDTNASCPFDPKICKSKTGNLLIDTGMMDTHDDLGRNAPPNQRMKFRRTVHCAPLATEGYRFRSYDLATNRTYTTYYYGPMLDVNGSTTVNYTTRFSDDDLYPNIEELTHTALDTVHDFSVRQYVASPWNGSFESSSSSFVPVPELTLDDSDIFIFFLSSGSLLFSSPSNDSWYGGTTNTTQIHKLRFSGWGNTTMYRQSEPGSPLACKGLEQYCITGASGKQKCTLLEGPSNAAGDVDDLVEKEDRDWFDFLFRTTFARMWGTDDPMGLLGTHVLLARNKLSGPILGPIPDNQWQLEVQHWHATSMAKLQELFLDTIIGFKDPKYSHLVRYPKTNAAKELCANQKILAEGFISLSVFGLACIFLGGSLIIMLSFLLGPMLSCCMKRKRRYRYAKLEWSTTDILQMQRLAHESSGMDRYNDREINAGNASNDGDDGDNGGDNANNIESGKPYEECGGELRDF